MGILGFFNGGFYWGRNEGGARKQTLFIRSLKLNRCLNKLVGQRCWDLGKLQQTFLIFILPLFSLLSEN